MATQAPQNSEVVQCSGSEEVDAVKTNSNVDEAQERTRPTNFQDSVDENNAATKIGANHLIVDNVIRHCDRETGKFCLLVNHMWRQIALKYYYLDFTLCWDKHYPEIHEILQNKQRLPTFNSIAVNGEILPAMWKTYSPELTDFFINEAGFSEDGLYQIIVDNFPKLKSVEVLSPYLQRSPKCNGPLKHLFGTTPQVRELNLQLNEDLEYSEFFSDDLCFKLLARLGNLKVLSFSGGAATRKIPLFASLLNGNVKLQQLKYYPQSNQTESADVINNYFQRCGESLRHIEMTMPFLWCGDAFAGYKGKYLEYVKVRFQDLEMSVEFEKRILDLSKYEMGNLPSLQSLPHIPRLERWSRYNRTKPVTTLEELLCKSCFRRGNYDIEGAKMDEVFKIFSGTSLLLLAPTIGFPNEYYLRIDELIAAGKAFPNLAHLVIDAELDLRGSQNIMVQVVVHFRELETFVWWRNFDANGASLLLALPKLTTVRLRSLTIPTKLYDCLNNHVANLEVDDVTLL